MRLTPARALTMIALTLTIVPGACALADEAPRAAPPACDGTLAERWACAVDAMARTSTGGTTWIGWSIERSDQALIISDTGIESHEERRRETLAEILGESPRRGARRVAFLFAFPAGAEGPEGIVGTRIRSLIAPVDVDPGSLVWLGEAGEAESVALLESIFAWVRDPEARSDYGPMIALHQDGDLAIPVLRRIVLGGFESEAVRAEALAWIGYARNDPKVQEIVLEAIGSDPSSRVVDEGLGALDLRDGSGAVLRTLIGLLVDHPDPGVRAQVAEALEETGSPQVVAPLVRAAMSDPSALVRMEAVDALGDARGAGARRGLERLGRDAGDAAVRREALDRLEE